MKQSFKSLGLKDNIVHSIFRIFNNRVEVPSSIQYGAIPLILQNKNVIFTSETGSGKTIAYLAPIIQMIEDYKINFAYNLKRSPLGLVILPSRELTEQVGKVALELCLNTNVGVATMIGGLPKHIQHTGLDLVISTIGLVESHINKGYVK